MKISILTFDGFNELDSLIAFSLLKRVAKDDWVVDIVSPTNEVTSMNGLVIGSHAQLESANDADVVIVGSGMKTREIIADNTLLQRFNLDPTKQIITAQCSGTLILAKLGLLNKMSACTDLTTQPWVEEMGVAVLSQPFFAQDNIATAGGCLASQYLASWIVAKTLGIKAAQDIMYYVAPVAEKQSYIDTMTKNISQYL